MYKNTAGISTKDYHWQHHIFEGINALWTQQTHFDRSLLLGLCNCMCVWLNELLLIDLVEVDAPTFQMMSNEHLSNAMRSEEHIKVACLHNGG